ncbi:dihydropteroate synthase [Sphaerisporangium rufum]|uniref:Dihydropteroate synthase n=1 Tax=Sphaerisporangium rufum TaxID=1381558 RepID=A0A919V153_9ACTN|nr:dihydropteroate synthase [Sphaerisporangium rufum]GII77488.1 dihydropteroate synthase [Sphaerisporangium rufum]
MDANGAGRIFHPPLISPERTMGRRRFDFARQVAVMAIINRTPDSFHDRGATYELGAAVDAAERAVAAGADWLDFGGMPFGAAGPPVPVAEEIERVVPLIEAVRGRTDAVISVDTHRADVARQALAAGADVVNDTNGLRDPGLAGVIADAGAHVVITHSLGGPRQAVRRPGYDDVVAEVARFLRERVAHALDAGIAAERIIIDPGHDLNKNTYHSLEITRRLPEIAEIGHPTLAAVSNKDFIGETLGAPQGERLAGTLAAISVCVLLGARIVRVHDVAPAVAAVRMVEAMLGWREPLIAEHNLD